MNNDLGMFLDDEFRLLSSCSTIPDSNFEDYQAQALYSTTYMLWLVKVKMKNFREIFHDTARVV